MSEADRLLRAEEVARILSVRKKRIYDLVARTDIPHVRLGSRQLRFPAAALSAWIARGGSAASEG